MASYPVWWAERRIYQLDMTRKMKPIMHGAWDRRDNSSTRTLARHEWEQFLAQTPEAVQEVYLQMEMADGPAEWP